MIHRFGDFRLDPGARELRRGEDVVALPASAFDCLLYLLENRQRAVGKDELIAAIWGRADATDALLAQTLVRVRKALGDTGNAQHTILTVPRFGYRWVAEVHEDMAEPTTAPVATGAAAPVSIEASGTLPPPRAQGRRWRMAATLVVIVTVLAAMAWQWQLTAQRVPSPGAAPTVAVPATVMSAALVFPAEVNAPVEWAWLRLGLMDLVANRLRRGDLGTAASESVVGLLGAEASGSAPRHDDPRFAALAALRIVPRAALDEGRWRVRLDVLGGAQPLSAEANAVDILDAGREASDQLLVALGHVPPKGLATGPAALDELLQRTRAAMLGNQFDLATRLIDAAAPALREHPEVVLREANIELRRGGYLVAMSRLQRLLDSAAGDEWKSLRGRALITLAAIHIRRNEDSAADQAYAEAIALLQDSGDFNSLGLAHHGRGLVALVRGDVDAALPDLGRARTEMTRAGSTLGIAQIDMNLALIQTMRHRPADALAALRAVEQRLVHIGAREELIHTYASEAENQIELLDYADALATTERFWPPESHGANVRTAWRLKMIRARALAGVGRVDDARALVEAIRAGADPAQDEVALAHTELIAAHLASLRGDGGEAVRCATIAASPVLRNGEDMSWYARAWLFKIRALRDEGRNDDAALESTRFDAWARERGDAWALALADTTLADQAWADGRSEVAFGLYARALGGAERVGVPIDTIAVAEPYLNALIERARLDEAKAVNGRISPWADRDLRAAAVQARLFEALGEDDAAVRARGVVAQLSGREVTR